MKRVSLFVGFWWVAVHVIASEYDSLKLRADVLYQAGKFDTAYWVYEGLLKEGLKDGYLYFNMANTCMQLGKTNEAVAWYEKALLSMPDDQRVLNNLMFALGKMELDRNPDERRLTASLSPWLAIIAWWIGIFLLGWSYFNRRKKLRKWFIATGLLLLVLSVGILTNEYFLSTSKEAIVLEDSFVLAQPAELSGKVYELSAGTKVKVVDSERGWWKVLIPNGRKGWVRGYLLHLL